MNEALRLFGDENTIDIILKKTFNEYYHGYSEDGKHIQGYSEIIEEIESKFPNPGQRIDGESNQREFMIVCGKLLRMHNILRTFPDYLKNKLLEDRDLQNYQGVYRDLYQRSKIESDTKSGTKIEQDNLNPDLFSDIVFEVEILDQLDINVDHIVRLVEENRLRGLSEKDILAIVENKLNASLNHYNKKDILLEYVLSGEEWQSFILKKIEIEISRIIREEKLDDKKTRKFIENFFTRGSVSQSGEEFSSILPRIGLWDDNYNVTNDRVFKEISNFYEKFDL